MSVYAKELVFTLNAPSLFLTNSQVHAVHAVKAPLPDREARGVSGKRLNDQSLNWIVQSHRASSRAVYSWGGIIIASVAKIEIKIDNWSVKGKISPF